MTENIGSLDRILRLVVGLALLSMLFWVDGDVRWLGLIGLIPIGTAVFRWCPLYSALGFHT